MIVWRLYLHIFGFYDFPALEENISLLFCRYIWFLPEHTPGYVPLVGTNYLYFLSRGQIAFSFAF